MSDNKSIEQQLSEVEYWKKQKILVEEIIRELNDIPLWPWNIWRTFKLLKRLIAAIGTGTATTLVQQADTWEAIMFLNDSIRSLNSMIVSLHQRVSKLEERR